MQIAKYFAKFGIDIDPNVLKNIQTTFNKMEKMAEQMDKKLQKLESNKNKLVLANLKLKEQAIQKSLDKEYDMKKRAADRDNKLAERQAKAARDREYKLQNFGREFNPYKAESAAYAHQRKMEQYANDQKRYAALEASSRGRWSPQLLARQGVQQWTPPAKPSLAERMFTNGKNAWGTAKFGAGAVAGTAGMLARFGPAALGAAGGFLALKGVSDRSQRVQAADLGLESVLAAYGLENKHDQIFNRYKKFSSSIGVDWLGGADQFNSFLSSAMGMGVSTNKAIDQYEGISSYARAMHLDPYKQKLVMQGLRDMLGKGTVQAEEWKKQIGGNLPGGVAAFAEAYQRMTGGKLTGQESIAAFISDASKGKIASAPLIEHFSEVLKNKSQKGLEVTRTSAQTAQANLANQFNQMFNLANKGGLDKNFADLFNGLTDALRDITPILQTGFTGLGHGMSVLGSAMKGVASLFGIKEETTVGGKSLVDQAAGIDPNDKGSRRKLYDLRNAYTDKRLDAIKTAKGMSYGEQFWDGIFHPNQYHDDREKLRNEFDLLVNSKRSSSNSMQSNIMSKMTGFNASTMESSGSGISISNSTFNVTANDPHTLMDQLHKVVIAHNSPEVGGK